MKLADKLDRSSKISAHSLRKFFQTQMEAVGVPKNWIGKFQGKKIGDSTGLYSRPEELGLLMQAYIGAYDKLRVFEESNQKIRKQNERIRELEAEGARLRSEKREAEELTSNGISITCLLPLRARI